MDKYKVKPIDKIVSAVSYITMGWGGLFYLIYMAFKRKPMTHFTRYNILQSIFVSFLYFILAFLFGALFNLLSYIPLINTLVAKLTLLLNSEFMFNYSIIQIVTIGIVVYMTLFALLGRYPRIYIISGLIDKQVR